VAAIPSAVLCIRRTYRPSEIVALADSLSGGHGTLLTLAEVRDSAWIQASLPPLTLPKLRPWRRLSLVFAAAAFLAASLMVPQRMLSGNSVLAGDIVSDLEATLEQLKQEDLVTTEEARELEEEIERIRNDAEQRLDASTWEAADALREKVEAGLGAKEDAVQWAQESLARYADAAQAGAPPNGAQADELASAIEKLAQTGMLGDAPADLQQLLGGREALAVGNVRLPSDPRALRQLARALAQHLGDRSAQLGQLGRLSREPGRFDPSEFGEFNYDPQDGDGDPGTGGLGRGRADAELTWGDESLPFDRFKPTPLPPGSVRSPDDWAPVAILPGAPQEAPALSGPSTGVQFSGTAGQAAWRRTLAPRHYSAVKKYFENSGQNGPGQN
jgi:hypothetical protein